MIAAPLGMQKPPYSMLLTEVRKSDVIALAAGAATITIPFDKDYAHSFAGITYYDNVAALPANQVLPTAGTETYTVETLVKPGIFQAVTGSPLNSVDQVEVGFDANPTQIRVVLAAVDVATHVILRVSGNSA